MAKLSKYKLDAGLASDGRWCRYKEDIEFKVASAAQDEFANEARRICKKLKQENGGEEVSIDAQLRGLAKSMANHLVKDWRGIEDDETGQPIPFSIAKAREYLVDPAMHELRQWVLSRASEYAEYQAKAREADAKN